MTQAGGSTCIDERDSPDDRGYGQDVLPEQPVTRAQSLLRGGAHALHVDGDLQASREWYDAAFRVAQREGDDRGMAMAALGLGGLWVHEHRNAAAAVVMRDRLNQALTGADPQSLLALRIRARLAGEADYRSGGHAAILAILDEVRRCGDPVASAEAVSLAHHCLLGPEYGAIRRELAEELIALAARTGSRSDLLMGLLWRAVDLILDGDPHAERSVQELRDLLARENHLAVGYVVRCIEVMLAIRAGRFAEAEELAQACFQRGQEAGDADATGWFGGQMVAIRWYQGRLGELMPMLRTMVNSPTLSVTDSSHVISLAVAAATVGEQREAAGALARVAGGGLARLPRSSSWLVSMYGIAEATQLLGDVETAAAAYELLRPFSGLPLVGGIGVACFGSVQHALGVASLTTGHVQRAVDHLRCAVSENLALGHWPATVLSRVRLAEALVLRVESADVWGTELVAEADQALDSATREAAGLGMALPPSVADLRGRLARAAARGTGSQLGAVRGVAGVAPRVAFQRVGRQWQVAFGHRTALVDHSVGMRYLAVLTANPGYEVPAIELAAGAGQSAEIAADRAGSSHQPVLDEVAMREYRQRLASLADEIDKYELSNDLGRAEVARAERDWLIAELTAAAGLGGRVREFSSGEERARISVGKAIRRALERITTVDPTIGAELRATIQTGLRCCYQPR